MAIAIADVIADRLKISSPHTGKFRLNESYRPIAEALVAKYREISHVPVDKMIFIENTDATPRRKGRFILAQIGVVPPKWSEIIEQLTGVEVAYWMEIFKKHVEGLSREQIIALIYHELRHVSRLGGIVGHDVEDWANMISALGTRWNCVDAEVPDLLAEGVDWESIQANKLVDDPEPEEEDGAADDDEDVQISIAAGGQTVTTTFDQMRRATERLRQAERRAEQC